MKIKGSRNLQGGGWGKSCPYNLGFRMKGNWLREFDFVENTLITVDCEPGKLTITFREEEPVPEAEPPVSAPKARKRRK